MCRSGRESGRGSVGRTCCPGDVHSILVLYYVGDVGKYAPESMVLEGSITATFGLRQGELNLLTPLILINLASRVPVPQSIRRDRR